MYIDYFPGLFLPPGRDRWIDRIDAGITAFESTLGVALAQCHSGTKRHVTTRAVPDRRKFLAGRLKTRNRWFSLFQGRHFPADYFSFGGNMYLGDELYRARVVTPELPMETHEKLIVALGEALEVHSVQFTPGPSLRRQRHAHWCTQLGDNVMRNQLPDRTAAESALPVICESTYEGLTPLQPHHFGWLNYWSKEVCDAIGFSGRVAGADLLRHSYETPRGAWLVKLCAQPPEVIDDEFARRLATLYAAFPEVARRLP